MMKHLQRGNFVRLKPDAARRCGFIFGRATRVFKEGAYLEGNSRGTGAWYVSRDEISRAYPIARATTPAGH